MKLLLPILLLTALPVLAQDKPPPTPPETDKQGIGDANVYSRKRPPEELRKINRTIAGPRLKVDANEVLDQIIDEWSSDMARLGHARYSPVLFDRIRLTSNIAPQFGAILETRMTAALLRESQVAVVRCTECATTRSRIENANWVVTRGVTNKAELAGLGKEYGAKALLSVSLTIEQSPALIAMDVELVRAEDSTVLFAETYRASSDDAIIYRGADRAQSREQAMKDLERRLNARPLWQMNAMTEALFVPSSGTAGWAGLALVDLLERGGSEREWSFGISAGGIVGNFAGGAAGATLLRRIGEESINGNGVSMGLTVVGVITGNSGTSALLTSRIQWVMGYRMGITGSLGYLAPFKINNKDPSYGGFVPGLGGIITW
jgi:curli biogenesis system outer membrane secretion channel CsgG